MGTRADFYIGRGATAEWIGSIAWDGYPDGIPAPILNATDEDTFRAEVAALLSQRDDGTTPDMGWPWPWDDSGTTDYAYAFDGGQVYASNFGCSWWPATAEEPDDGQAKAAVFPDMSDRKATTFGKRSGVMFFSA